LSGQFVLMLEKIQILVIYLESLATKLFFASFIDFIYRAILRLLFVCVVLLKGTFKEKRWQVFRNVFPRSKLKGLSFVC
uniref:Secreted protein n=1 Tax=Parascaris univalens TaxID=6257 RepID=A0A915BB43_PARUN